MADYIIDGEILTDIADALRNRTGDMAAIVPEDMAKKIIDFEPYPNGDEMYFGDEV